MIEESPSPAKALRDNIQSGRESKSESPGETAMNFSGTTIFPVDSDPETGGLDPVILVEALPDLQRAADGVMSILVPENLDSISVLSNAQRLRDPKEAQSRRLKRFATNLNVEVELLGSRKYVDFNRINSLLPTVQWDEPDGQRTEWNPAPIVYKANCANFAKEVLLAGGDANSAEQFIKELMERFPSSFMTGFTTKNELGKHVGRSALDRETFDLALDICTQYLRMELNARQHRGQFDQEAMLNKIFFNKPMGKELGSVSGQLPLHSLNTTLFLDENGRLPQRFEEAIDDRVFEIRESLSGDQDGPVNFQALNSDYRWRKFIPRAVRWVQKRDREISEELKRQPSLDYVRDVVEESKRRSSKGQRDMPVDHTDHAKQNNGQQAVEDDAQQHKPSSTKPAVRRKSKGTFRNALAIERVTERLRSAAASEPQRQSDHSGSKSDHRQKLPAVMHQPIEIPASPEADRASPPPNNADLEDGFVPVSDSHLDVGDTMEREAEKSHSPPIVNRTIRERRRTASRENSLLQQADPAQPTPTHPNRDPGSPLPSDHDIWRADYEQPAPRPSRSPMQDPRRRAFIDRQEDAYRVSPISQSTESAERRHDLPHNPSKRKRDIFDSDDDGDDDDDEFSRDDRAVDIADKRAQKPEQPQHKRQRLNDDFTEDASASQLQRGLEGSTLTASSIFQREDTNGPVENQGSSRVRHILPSTQSPVRERPPTSRQTSSTAYRYHKAWSHEENERLIYLVGLYGTHWARIKRNDGVCPPSQGGPRLADRDQIQIKDRARNLLLGYLR